MNTDPTLPEFTKLESLPVRAVWSHEAQSFTPWLAAHLEGLSAAIGVRLRLVRAKVVGDSRIADLLARDERDGSIVVIENQLETADDAHLGQILTYAAAIDARAVVWVAPRFNTPHLAAVRWLNAKAGPAVGFYAVEVRVVRIGLSALAPVFTALERPNDGASALRPMTGAPIPLDGFASAFWAAHLQRHPDEAARSRPVGERCRWRATKPSGVVIGQHVQEHSACVFLRGRNGVTLETVWAMLAPFAEKLERRLGVSLRGDRPALLAVKVLEIDVANPANSPEISDWLQERTMTYDAALRDLAGERVGRPGRRATIASR